MLRDKTGPAETHETSNALAETIDILSNLKAKLEYVFADFEFNVNDGVCDIECDTTKFSCGMCKRQVNVLEMVSVAKATYPDVWVGAYAFYPGMVDSTSVSPSQVDRADLHEFYLQSGLNVAMSNAYPYEEYVEHMIENDRLWGKNVAPTERSALFWGPLEKISLVQRSLPEGHKHIPWLAGLLERPNYNAKIPPDIDQAFLVKHARLRGISGYIGLAYHAEGEWNKEDSRRWQRNLSSAWKSLDWLFDSEEEPVFLNLSTDKTSGVQWSGVMVGNTAVFALSNLGSEAARVDFPEISGGPNFSQEVQPGEHTIVQYDIN